MRAVEMATYAPIDACDDGQLSCEAHSGTLKTCVAPRSIKGSTPFASVLPYVRLLTSRSVTASCERSMVQLCHSITSLLALIAAALLRSEEHTSELQSLRHLVCRLLLEKKNK